MINSDYIDINKYEILDKIGDDSTGEIFMVKLKDKKSQQVFLSKIYQKSIKRNQLPDFSTIDHPSVLKIIGFSPINFKKEKNAVIITDYLPNGSLQKLIDAGRKGNYLKELHHIKKLIILYGIASGMNYLHSQGIIQHILRPENIYLDTYLFPKINYFTISKNIIDHPTYFDITPEGIELTEYTEKSDVYAFALIAYILISFNLPYENMKFLEIMEEVKKGKRPQFDTEKFSPAMKDLIERCWDQDPKKRPSFADIITELKENSEYIQNSDKSQELFDYIDHIETQKDLSPSLEPISLHGDDDDEIDDDDNSPNLDKLICPKEIFINLNETNQSAILEAEKSANVQFKVAQNFLTGTSKFPKNDEIGLSYLYKSILNGNDEALNMCTKKYMEDEKEIKAAKKFIEDHKNEIENPVFDYINGIILLKEKKYDAAIQSFMKSVEKGSPKAAKKLGEMHRDGLGVKRNGAESTRYFTMANQMKKTNAIKTDELIPLFLNGLQCLDNYHEEKIKEAIKCFEESAKKGYLQSIKKLAQIYFYGFHSIDVDYEKALHYSQIAFQKGDLDSIKILASISEKNPENEKQTFQYYEAGAIRGDVDFIYKTADFLFKKYEDLVQKANKSAPNQQKQFKDNSKNKLKNSMKYFKMASEKGNPYAIYQYANHIKISNKKESNSYFILAASFGHAKSKELIESTLVKNKAENGDIESMYNYALTLIQSKKTYKKAIKYLEKAAEGGHSEAKKELTKTKIKDIKNDIQKGNPNALAELAKILSERKAYRNDIEKTNACLTNAVQLYDPFQTVNLVDAKELILLKNNNKDSIFKHANKLESSDSIERAKFWYKRAADLGSEDGMLSYINLIRQEIKECFRSQKKLSKEEFEYLKSEEIKYLKMSADLGNDSSMISYAKMLEFKIKEYQNAMKSHRRPRMSFDEFKAAEIESVKYTKKAADKGNRIAMNDYGLYLEFRKKANNPKEKTKNIEEAKSWYKKAADLGSVRSMLNYARLLDKSVRDNRTLLMKKKTPILTQEQYEEAMAEAAKYYKSAAEQGNRNAMYFYALYLEHGNGIPVDKEKAFELYLKSAEKGNPGAMSNCARCLEHGKGTTQNKVEALKWYKKAWKSGYKKSEDEYNYLLREMQNEGKNIVEDDDDDIKIKNDEEEEEEEEEETNEKTNKRVKSQIKDTSSDDNNNDDDESDVDVNEDDDDSEDIEEIDDTNENNVKQAKTKEGEEEDDIGDNDDDDDYDENDKEDGDEDDEVDQNNMINDDDDDDNINNNDDDDDNDDDFY